MYLPIYHPITVPYMTNTVATDSPLCKYRLKKKKNQNEELKGVPQSQSFQNKILKYGR